MNWIYAHLIGDFLIQNDWMANGKKNSSCICAVHVLTYLVPFLFTNLSWGQLAAIGAQHFCQDRLPLVGAIMLIKGSESFSKPPLGPWSVILIDQILHILFIAAIAA